MPGIGELPYTDALLYAPPEQLTNPDGYLEGAGYGWDVYAFGTLAFRLLNGVFPRCHDTFEQVAPAMGEQRRRGVEADCERIAMKLQKTAIAEWKGSAPTREEEEGREVIERCLNLDPWKRFADMREVLRALEGIASARQQRLAQEADEERVQLVERKRRGWQAAAGIGIAACLGLGAVVTYQIVTGEDEPVVVQESSDEPSVETTAIDSEELKKAKRAVLDALAERNHFEAASEEKQQQIREMAADMVEAHQLSDELLSWSLERGAEQLPTLEGRTGRLALLEKRLVNQLQVAQETPAVQRSAWKLKLALAEISLAADRPKVARERLKEVLNEATATDDYTMHRLARTRVLVCLLGSKDPEVGVTPTELAETENVLASLPEGTRQARRLKSALKVAEARMQFRNGDSAAALENYRTAFADMTKLCEEQPSLSALRIWRARGYTSAARAANGAGEVDAAILLREQAAVELMELLEVQPNRPDVQVELSEALGAIAEAALEEGEIERAEDLAARALELLETAVANPAQREGALNQLAGLKSVLAACRAGTGYSKDALRLVREGRSHVDAALKRNAKDPVSRYRLAVLCWQECGLTGTSGNHGEAVKLGMKAREILNNLVAENVTHPSQREIKRSLAYLTSDLGHAAQLASRNTDAVNYFRESVATWKALAEAEGNNDEFQEGYSWAIMRLRELGQMTSIPRKVR